jgi:hypothetical protein
MERLNWKLFEYQLWIKYRDGLSGLFFSRTKRTIAVTKQLDFKIFECMFPHWIPQKKKSRFKYSIRFVVPFTVFKMWGGQNEYQQFFILSLIWMDKSLTYTFVVLTMWEGSSCSRSYGSWIYNYLCNQCQSPLTLWVRIPLRQSVLNTTLCDKVCHWLAAGRWFSSISKIDHNDITEILLKVALNTITLTLYYVRKNTMCWFFFYTFNGCVGNCDFPKTTTVL